MRCSQLLLDALQQNDCVIVDDLHLASAPMGDCNHFYPRSGFLDSPMNAIAAYVIETGKKLVLGSNGQLPGPLRDRCYDFGIDDFEPDDYQHLCARFLGRPADGVNFEKVHRFAPKLNAHQLKLACGWMKGAGDFETDSFIDYLRSQQLASNVSLGEVANVELSELKGVDDVIASLEAHIAVPLENDELTNQLGLRPKRGVLLVGPPGAGKTSGWEFCLNALASLAGPRVICEYAGRLVNSIFPTRNEGGCEESRSSLIPPSSDTQIVRLSRRSGPVHG